MRSTSAPRVLAVFGAALAASLWLACTGSTTESVIDDGGTPGADGGALSASDAGPDEDAGAQLEADAGTDALSDGGISISVDGGETENPPPPGTTPGLLAGDPCAAGTKFETGEQFRSIVSEGGLRWFYLHVPKDYAGKPVMLVMNFHGYTSDPLQQALLSKMNDEADKRGFIVAYPAGINRAWNAGQCCGDPAWLTKIDDVQFVRDAVASISHEYCVDAKRIYSTGMSNGGFISHRLACEASDLFAAVAPVAGVVGIPTCNPPRHVPVMHFHGTDDPLVPYYGGSALGFPSVPVTYGSWLFRNDCTGTSKTIFEKGDSSCETFSGCPANGETILCTVDGGGHTWPGGTPVPPLGYTTTDMDATKRMLDFFEKHPMP